MKVQSRDAPLSSKLLLKGGLNRQQRSPGPLLIGLRYGTGLSHADTEIPQSFIPLKLPGMAQNSTIWVMLMRAEMFRE